MQRDLRSRRRDYLIGDKAFYKAVFAIVLPIIVQNLITSFVNLLDNLMVGQLGTESMSGVAIANQLFFIFNICIFGGISGASIYGAQFFGAKDYEGMRNAARVKLYITLIIFLVCGAALAIFRAPLIRLFLTEGEDPAAVALTMNEGEKYLLIMLAGLLPFAVSQSYSSTLREAGETLLPMVAGIIAIMTNMVLNYILIFGKLGAPELGVSGAAIATVISRYVETAIIVVVTHLNKVRYYFMTGLYRTFRVPAELLRRIIVRGLPLLANEGLWSVGMAFITQLFSVRGLNVVAAVNIAGTVSNLFNTVVFAMGNAVAVMVGQALGADEFEKAKKYAWRLLFFSVVTAIGTGLLLAAAAPFIPKLYNTSDEVRSIARDLMLILGGTRFLMAITHVCYFAMRSGGKTVLTFIFDCLSVWVLNIPLVYVLIHFTGMGIRGVYAMNELAALIKSVFGLILLKKGIWIHNVTREGR